MLGLVVEEGPQAPVQSSEALCLQSLCLLTRDGGLEDGLQHVLQQGQGAHILQQLGSQMHCTQAQSRPLQVIAFTQRSTS